MKGPNGRLTTQQDQFVKLVVEEGYSLVGAYRLAYPPRKGTRSPGAERVAAKRVAHHPLVEQRMEQLREELRASDPVEMRRRANAVLGQILAKQLDPRYRRTALDVLRRLDEQERAAAKADREAYQAAVTKMQAIDAIEGGRTNRARSISARPLVKEQPRIDVDHLIDEIDQLIEEERHSRDFEPTPIPMLDSRPDDPPQATGPEAAVKESGFQWARKPGHFGRGGWIRLPNPR